MRRIAFLALALLAVPACGGEEAPEGGAPPNGAGAAAGAFIEVVLTDFSLSPAGALRPGTTTLRVVNDGEVVHVLRVEGPGVEAETGSLAPGESEELEVHLTEGDVVLWCPVGNHRELGMEATVSIDTGGEAPAEDTTTGEEEDGYRY